MGLLPGQLKGLGAFRWESCGRAWGIEVSEAARRLSNGLRREIPDGSAPLLERDQLGIHRRREREGHGPEVAGEEAGLRAIRRLDDRVRVAAGDEHQVRPVI